MQRILKDKKQMHPRGLALWFLSWKSPLVSHLRGIFCCLPFQTCISSFPLVHHFVDLFPAWEWQSFECGMEASMWLMFEALVIP